MKVMFVPTMDTKVSCRGSNRVVTQASHELPKYNEGVSNEQIYNAIMLVKNRVVNLFTPNKKNKSINLIA